VLEESARTEKGIATCWPMVGVRDFIEKGGAVEGSGVGEAGPGTIYLSWTSRSLTYVLTRTHMLMMSYPSMPAKSVTDPRVITASITKLSYGYVESKPSDHHNMIVLIIINSYNNIRQEDGKTKSWRS